MKTPSAVLLLLLLLWAGLVAVEAEDKDLQEKSTDRASTQVICQPDIHTALREMSVLVGKLEVELRYTKTQMEVLETQLRVSESKAETMETRLRASENKAETMETRLRASERTVEEHRVELRQTEARLTDSESLVQKLNKENEALQLSLNGLRDKQEEQTAAVTAVGGRVNLTGSQVEELRREREESRVALSASLVASARVDVGPFSRATPLVYSNVFVNIGDAYSSKTGVFTTPVRGVYHFVVFVFGHGRPSTSTGVTLHKNGEQVFLAYSLQHQHAVSPSNGASLLLEVGDEVYLRLWPNSWIHDTHNHHNTFSGHLLFPM